MKSPEIRPFIKEDWYGYGGAALFPNNDHPLICEFMIGEIGLVMIGCYEGISLDVNTPQEEYSTYFLKGFDGFPKQSTTIRFMQGILDHNRTLEELLEIFEQKCECS